MRKNTYHVAYAGLDCDTWFLLVNEPAFTPRLVAMVPDLLEKSTFNPFNLLLKHGYRFYIQGSGGGTLATITMLRLIFPFLTSAWRKYCPFIISIMKNRVVVVDFNNTKQIVSLMQKHNVDLLVINIWGLLPAQLIDTPAHGTINVHPSKLPQYRGSVPTLMTLKNQDSESAVSYIMLDSSVDGGKLIGQHIFPVSSTDTYYTIEQKITQTVAETLVKDLLAYLSGKTNPQKQSSIGHSITPKYSSYMKIDWETEWALDIYNKVNAYPYIEAFDYCFTFLPGNQKLFFKGVAIARKHKRSHAPPGSFTVHGIIMYICSIEGEVSCILFKDIGYKDSIRILTLRKGQLLTNGDNPE